MRLYNVCDLTLCTVNYDPKERAIEYITVGTVGKKNKSYLQNIIKMNKREAIVLFKPKIARRIAVNK